MEKRKSRIRKLREKESEKQREKIEHESGERKQSQ